MASPQLENGHSRIAHELLEQIYRAHLSSSELCTVLSIIRHSYGWGKKEARISISFLAKDTGLPDRSISRALMRLNRRKIILRNGLMAGIQKDYQKWIPLSKLTDPSVKNDRSVKNGVKPLSGVTEPPLSKLTEKKEAFKAIKENPYNPLSSGQVRPESEWRSEVMDLAKAQIDAGVKIEKLKNLTDSFDDSMLREIQEYSKSMAIQ